MRASGGQSGQRRRCLLLRQGVRVSFDRMSLRCPAQLAIVAVAPIELAAAVLAGIAPNPASGAALLQLAQASKDVFLSGRGRSIVAESVFRILHPDARLGSERVEAVGGRRHLAAASAHEGQIREECVPRTSSYTMLTNPLHTAHRVLFPT